MLNTFCVECGAVNHIGEQNCVGCGANLAIQPDFPLPEQPREWEPLLDPRRPLPGIPRFTVGRVVSTTLKLFTKNLWTITKIVFLVVAPFEVFKVLSLSDPTDDSQRVWALFLGWLCNLLIAPALIYALMKILETTTTPGVNESVRWGLSKLWRLAICAAIATVLQGLGYMLCIIPGIIVSLTLVVVYPVTILERGSVADVLRRSSQLTRGFRLEILAAEIVLGLLAAVFFIPASIVAANMNSLPLVVLVNIFTDIIEQGITVMSLVMYLSLLRTPTHGHAMLSVTK